MEKIRYSRRNFIPGGSGKNGSVHRFILQVNYPLFLLVLRTFFILCLFLCLSCQIEAQTIPPSPEGSGLVRSVSNPVNYGTGVVGIQIPLYSISCGEMSVPISLFYQASGIKVRDVAGWTGLGWNLSTGGKVTRVVRKRPDENGYCKSTDTLQCDGYQASQLEKWSAKFDERYNGSFDGEPDLFYYEFSGRSGMFVVDYKGEVYPIPYEKLNIQWVDKKYFIITDEKGCQYIFGDRDKEISAIAAYSSSDPVRDTFSFVSTWYLSQMEDIRKNTINFEYVAGKEQSSIDKQMNGTVHLEYSYGWTLGSRDSTEYYTEMKVKPKFLRKIVTTNGEMLEFESNDDPTNTITNRRLSEIKIYSTADRYLKSIKFDYSYFGNTCKRLKLDKVYEASNGKTIPISHFDYAAWHIPDMETLDFDHWGYYNGANNKSNFVKGVYKSVSLSGANREANLQHAQSGILKRVYTSTGGYTEYEYKLNKGMYEKKSLTDSIEGGGMRIKSISQYAHSGAVPIVTRYSYTLPWNGRTSGMMTGRLLYYYDKNPIGNTLPVMCTSRCAGRIFDVDGAPMHYQVVTEHRPDGSSQEMHYMYSSSSDQDRPSLVYEVNALQYEPTPNYSDAMPNSSRFWKRGLMCAQIQYDENKDTLSYVRHSYMHNPGIRQVIEGYAPGKELGATKDLEPVDINLLWKYEWVSEPVLLKESIVWGKTQPEQVTAYTYDPDYLLPLNTVTKTKILHETDSVVYRYPFHYKAEVKNAGSNKKAAYALKCMIEKQMLDYPVETVTYKNKKVIRGEINEYQVIENNNGENIIGLPACQKSLLLTGSQRNYRPYCFSNLSPVCDPNYHTEMFYDKYDEKGNLLTSHSEKGDYRTVVYSYKNSLPVAVIENAPYYKVYYSNFEDDNTAITCPGDSRRQKVKQGAFEVKVGQLSPGSYKVSYLCSSDNGQTWIRKNQNLEQEKFSVNVENDVNTFSDIIVPSDLIRSVPLFITIGKSGELIDDLQIIPEKALIVTANYIPGVGKISETDHSGITYYYDYDEFGRLIRVLDRDKIVLKEYDYYIVP